MKRQIAISMLGFLGVFGVLAPAVTSTSASADSTVEARLRLFRFSFNCSFDDNDHPTALDSAKYTARAEVYAYVDPNDWMSTLEASRDATNHLVVNRDDRIIYADSAFLLPRDAYVAITGINGQPAVYVRRDDHASVVTDDDGADFEAVLEVRHHRVQGSCNVHTEPVLSGEIAD